MFRSPNSSLTSALIGVICVFVFVEQVHSDNLPVIPRPAEQSQLTGEFTLKAESQIYYAAQLESAAHFLASSIKQTTDLALAVSSYSATGSPSGGAPSIVLTISEDPKLGNEGYRLRAGPKKITITGNDAAGVYWGTQTLLQLFASSMESRVPACEITDRPRFPWRGVMLDVGRYMYDVEDIKELIDWMSLHKLNRLHWHLTEDQGWRIEIKKYPKLTEIGSRRESSPPYGDRLGSDGTPYEGYYTQEQIRDLVQYAAKRHITIVPEIDMPGHMSAAIASYPELGNDDIPDFAPKVASSWGVKHYTLSPKEETFQWIDDVLTEVCDLFPSEYIHIGGDEAPKEQWKQSAFAQSVIRREGLKDEHELQSWFIRQVEQILAAKNRKLVGWNEIRQGGLSPGATVMAWQSWDSAVDSAREGHRVIMAPKTHTYFDYYQADPTTELAKGAEYETIGSYLPLSKAYDFDPVPEGLIGTEYVKYILGCQGQLWSEYSKDWDKVQYMAFPRLYALAEAAWSTPEENDYEEFLKRLKPQLERLGANGVRYYDPFVKATAQGKHGAVISTSMPAYGESLPEYVYDGDARTYFSSSRRLEPNDHLTVKFKSPLYPSTVEVATGSGIFSSRLKKWIKSSSDALQHGVLEASVDGTDWQQVAVFENGTAQGLLPDKCQAIRIRATDTQTSPRLVIHEIQVSKIKRDL